MAAFCAVALSVAATSHAAEPQVSIAYPESSQPIAATDWVERAQFVPRLNMPPIGLNFLAQGFTLSPLTVTGAPSDVSGAVGPNHYVQTVNGGIEIWNKTGGIAQASRLVRTLWTGYVGTHVGNGCATRNDGHAVVLYDQLADRWLISQPSSPNFASSPNFQCVAVSKTGDPTGAYWLYDFSSAGLNDDPRFAVWPDAYYATYDLFLGGVFQSAIACGYDRSSMLNGLAASEICFQPPGVASLRPVSVDGPVAPPRDEPGFLMNFETDVLDLWTINIDWVTPSNSTLNGPTPISVGAFTPACTGSPDNACVPQPAPGALLRSRSDRLMSRVTYRNFGTHEAIVANHTIASNTTSGIRWYEIRSPNLTPSIFQQGTYALDDTNWRWLASIAEDGAEGLAAGFSMSSATLKPSIAWTGRINTDPLGTMGQAESIIATGLGVGTVSSWGGYSSMTIDPVDDCTFWYTNELYNLNGISTWDTRIATVKFPNCHANDFSISVVPATDTVSAGTAIHYTITTTATAGSAETIELNVQDLPAGVTGSFSPPSVTAGSTSRLDVNASAGAPQTDPVTFTVIGKAASAVHAATAQVSVVDTPPPSAPANLVATAVTANQVAITWDPVAADSYDVYRRGAGESFTFLANRTSPSYTDTTAAPDTAYLYLVRAVGPGGDSAGSNADLATTTIFIDDPLVVNTTMIKTVHRDQLRTALTAVDALAGTTLIFPSSDPQILSSDITILRFVLDMARSTLGLPALSYTHTADVGIPIAAIDVQELRDGMK